MKKLQETYLFLNQRLMMINSIFFLLWIITLISFLEIRNGIISKNIFEIKDQKYICFEAELKAKIKK
jgi:hypothetical protein